MSEQSEARKKSILYLPAQLPDMEKVTQDFEVTKGELSFAKFISFELGVKNKTIQGIHYDRKLGNAWILFSIG